MIFFTLWWTWENLLDNSVEKMLSKLAFLNIPYAICALYSTNESFCGKENTIQFDINFLLILKSAFLGLKVKNILNSDEIYLILLFIFFSLFSLNLYIISSVFWIILISGFSSVKEIILSNIYGGTDSIFSINTHSPFSNDSKKEDFYI